MRDRVGAEACFVLVRTVTNVINLTYIQTDYASAAIALTMCDAHNS